MQNKQVSVHARKGVHAAPAAFKFKAREKPMKTVVSEQDLTAFREKFSKANSTAARIMKDAHDCLFHFFDGEQHYRTDIFFKDGPRRDPAQKRRETEILTRLVALGAIEQAVVPFSKNPNSTIPPSAYSIKSVSVLEQVLGDQNKLFQLLWPAGSFFPYDFQQSPRTAPRTLQEPVKALPARTPEPDTRVALQEPKSVVDVPAEPPPAVPAAMDGSDEHTPLTVGKFNDMFVSHFGMSFVEFMGGVVRVMHASGESQINIRENVDTVKKDVVALNSKLDQLLEVARAIKS